jgi:hypothetical protein
MGGAAPSSHDPQVIGWSDKRTNRIGTTDGSVMVLIYFPLLPLQGLAL